MTNSIIIISPYRFVGTWVFDDPATGLVREAFVSGADTIIDTALELQGLAGIERCKILFSAEPFPGYQFVLEKVRGEFGGTWYRAFGIEGWLCSALFLYFGTAPEEIYASVARE